MRPQDFQLLADFLRRRSGIALQPSNLQSIENRLMPVAKRHGFRDVGTFIAELTGGNRFQNAVVEAMTTHESYFFRDKASFDRFREAMLPRLMEARAASKRIRIWCAGASTGQEPYSLAMVLDGVGKRLAGWTVDMLATDIDAGVIARARSGFYSQFEILRGLPIQMLARYFSREEDGWKVSEAIRGRVRFEVFNLLDPFEGLGIFDVVFCRNVLIHFDPDAKRSVLKRLHAVLAPDGYLVLGSDETMVEPSRNFMSLSQALGAYVRSGCQPKQN